MSDQPDLARWISDRDEAAFTRLVAAHGGLVRAACRRQLGPGQSAEDATQAVFIILARRAGDIARPDQLGAWLCGTARKVCQNVRRAHARRSHHEQRGAVHAAAAAMSNPEDVWEGIRPFLDEAVASLDEAQRLVVVGHFLEGRTQAELAAGMGITENAVQKRIGSAVDKLRRWFGRRGVAVTAAVLCSGLVREASALEPGMASGLARAALHPPSGGPAELLAASTPMGGIPVAVVAGIALAALAGGAGLAWMALASPAAQPPPAPASVPAPASPAPDVLDRDWIIERGSWTGAGGIISGTASAGRGARLRSRTAYGRVELTCRLRVTGPMPAEIQLGGYRTFFTIPPRSGWMAVSVEEAADRVSCTVDGIAIPAEPGETADGPGAGPIGLYVGAGSRVEFADLRCQPR